MRPPSPRRRARALVASLALLPLTACATAADPAAPGTTSSASAPVASSLLVADPAAAAVHAYSLPDHELLGTLDGLSVHEHAGFVPLEDGRLLAAGQEPAELVALTVTEDGPQVVARTPLPGAAVHIAVDPDEGLAAVSTSSTTEGAGAITLVDLDSLEPRGTLDVATTEPGVVLAGGAVLHRDGAEQGTVELYPADALVGADGPVEPTASAPTGAWGHGEAVVDGHLLQATDAGLERFHVARDHLDAESTVPWAADGAHWGRAYYLRVVGAASPHVWSYVRDQTADAWGEWRNDVWVLAPDADAAERRPLGTGLAFRFAVGGDRVLFARMHPDGYSAHVVDADPGSPTYLDTLRTVPLPTPSGAPAADADADTVWSSPGRPIAALTPDGATGYVSRGGDGVVDVLDVEAGTVTGTIDVPTPLDGGGYLVVTGSGTPLVDLLGR